MRIVSAARTAPAQPAASEHPVSERRVKASRRQEDGVELDGRELSLSLADALEAILQDERVA